MPNKTAELVMDRSGSLIKNSVAQQVMSANPNRKGLLIQNVSNSDMWIRFKKKADFEPNPFRKWPSERIVQGATFMTDGPLVNTESISIIGKKAGSLYIAKEIEYT